MTFLSALADVWRFPLFELSGAQVSVGSLLIGLGVMAVGRVIAGLAGAALLRVLGRRGVHDAARFAVAKITRYVLFLVAVLVGLASIGLKLDALFAASAVLLVGIGFGLQNIAQNFISGLILLIERPIGKGDFVRIGDAYGSVVDIGLRATRIVTRDQVTILVPNSELINHQVINHSVPTTTMRIPVSVGVAYGSDTALVVSTLMAVAAAESLVLPEPPPEVRFEDFGDSSLAFALLVWIAEPPSDRLVASRLRFAIDAAFRSAGLEIPFPQRDLHVRSIVAREAPPAGPS